MEICCTGSCIEHPDDDDVDDDDDIRGSRGRQIVAIVLWSFCEPTQLCFIERSTLCAVVLALYAVGGLYEQANEHLAYKAKLSGINLSWRLGIVFPCGTGTASWNSTTDVQKRPTSRGGWYPLALKPSYYFSQMFGAVCPPNWNGTACISAIRNNWSENCCVLHLAPTIWMLPMTLMRLPSLIKRHCQHHPILLLPFYYIIYNRATVFPITKLVFQYRLYLLIDPIRYKYFMVFSAFRCLPLTSDQLNGFIFLFFLFFSKWMLSHYIRVVKALFFGTLTFIWAHIGIGFL